MTHIFIKLRFNFPRIILYCLINLDTLTVKEIMFLVQRHCVESVERYNMFSVVQ